MRYRLLALFSLGIVFSCSEKIDESSRKEVEIAEYRTNLPVGQATITLYKCTGYDAANQCIQKAFVAKYITNSDGKTSISQADLNIASAGLELKKDNYWTQDVGIGRNEINREGWLQLQITKVNNYPADARLYVYNRDQRGSLKPSFFTMNNLHDTTALIRAYGGQDNFVTWTVTNGTVVHSSGSLAAVFVPTTGNANTGFSY